MEMSSRRIVLVSFITYIICLSMTPLTVQAQSGSIDPSDVSITGSIVDNYANITYGMSFDNTASSSAHEVEWLFKLQTGIRLSNVSVSMGDDVYWGRVISEEAAVETYEESLEEGKTAVLVIKGPGGYYLRMNVENNTAANLKVFVEGLLVRSLGMYWLELPIVLESTIIADFTVDLTVLSHYGPIAGYSVIGLPTFDATDLTDGLRIQYTKADTALPSEISLSYFLDRQTGGSQLLTYNNGSQNFFAYLLAPSITSEDDRIPREYVFVLDRSGSMSGEKLAQAKVAFTSMIDDLDSMDIFNVVSFSTEVEILWAEPHSATGTNIDIAQNFVNGLTADGSTNFYGAGLTGLDTFTTGSYAKVMLFLSDGRPTSGATIESGEILAGLKDANDHIVSISTVAFGYDADESLMANLASQNGGFFIQVEANSEASTRLLDFYKYWSTPIAGGFSISVIGASDFFSLQPLGSAPFFNGTEVVMCGRYGSSITVETSIEYVSGIENYLNTALDGGKEYSHVERIWAQYKISWLLEMARLEGETSQIRQQIVDLGMQYGLVVDGYTGMILVAEVQEDTLPETEPTETDTTFGAVPPPAATTAYTTGTANRAATAPAADFAVSPLMVGTLGGVYFGGAVLVVIYLFIRWRKNRLG